MAPLQVIGVGWGRTGTDSLRTALNILGYHTHHMKSFIEDQEQNPDLFTEAYNDRKNAQWEVMYKDFNAAVDWPTAAFWKELLEVYPNAKFILTERNADDWYKSCKNTIASFQPQDIKGGKNVDRFAHMANMADTVCLYGYLRDKEAFADEERMKRLFLEHNAEVKRTIPEDQLLVMQLGEGWERLCDFLGKEVPDAPYPNVNSTVEMRQRLNKLVPASNDNK